MSGIKMLGFATVLAGGMGLASCSTPMADKEQMLEKAYIDAGVPADKFLKVKDSIFVLSTKHSYFSNDSYCGVRAFAWEKELDKIKLNHAVDSTRNVTRQQILDSLANVAKKIRK